MLSGESELDILRADPEYYLEAAAYFEKEAACNQDYDFPSMSGKKSSSVEQREKGKCLVKKGNYCSLR